MRRVAALFLSLIVLATANATAAEPGKPDVSIQNSYMVLKIDMGTASSGQKLVGAMWLRLRNISGHELSDIQLTLNSGLTVSKISDHKNRVLKLTARKTSLKGGYAAEVTEINAHLAKRLPADESIELMVYYDGGLRPMGPEAPFGAGTLQPDYALLHFWNFAYPAPGPADIATLTALYDTSRYGQDVQIELPENLKPVTNLPVKAQVLKGSRKQVDFKDNTPHQSPMIAIGRYETLADGAVEAHFLPGARAAAEALQSRFSAQARQLDAWLGDAPADRHVSLIDLPKGAGQAAQLDLMALPFADTPNEANASLITRSLINMHLPPSPDGADGSWREGLAAYLALRLKGADKAAIEAASFQSAGATDAGKMLLFFNLVNDSVGDDTFWDLLQGMRGEFGQFRTDNAMLADYMQEQALPKKLKKLAAAWLQDGKADKDISAAKDYAALVKKYR